MTFILRIRQFPETSIARVAKQYASAVRRCCHSQKLTGDKLFYPLAVNVCYNFSVSKTPLSDKRRFVWL
jgi:hypothetical protein